MLFDSNEQCFFKWHWRLIDQNHSPLPHVKHPRRLDHEHLKLVLQAFLADVPEAPVPVVVVEGAEVVGAGVQLAPQVAVEHHAHVVLVRRPGSHNGLV